MNAPGRHRRGKSSGGFTLVEVLAAMLFMAIVIPVAVEGIAIAGRAGVAAERRREAAQLGDALLTQKVVTGEWQEGAQAGDFGSDHPGFRWELTSTDWDQDAMCVVSVEVMFTVQGRSYSERLDTLVSENAFEVSMP